MRQVCPAHIFKTWLVGGEPAETGCSSFPRHCILSIKMTTMASLGLLLLLLFSQENEVTIGILKSLTWAVTEMEYQMPQTNHLTKFIRLSRDSVTIDGVRIVNRIYWTLWYSAWLHFTFQCCTLASSLSLLGSGFQRRKFPFLWLPELSPFSATSF
jgi:hypothetical protein